MAAVLSAALLLVAYGAIIQLVAALPIAAAAESLPENRPQTASRFWLAVSLFPLVSAVFLSAMSLTLPHTRYLSPHLERIRPHLCLRHLANAPDARWHFHLAGSIALGIIFFAVVRFAWRWTSSTRIERLASVIPGESNTLTVAADTPYSFTVGVRTGFVIISSGLVRILTREQLRAVEAHEVQHIVRGDNRVHLIMELAATMTTPSPLGFVYLMRWRATAEEACDCAAAEATSPEIVAEVLQLLAEHEAARLNQYSGGITPVYRPGISPTSRAAHIKADSRPQLAPSLTAVLVAEGLLAVVVIIMSHQWLTDTIYCAGEIILAIMGRS